MGNDLYELQKNLMSLGIVISFSGHFSQGIIEELSEAVKNHLENQEFTKGEIHNVISVFVEQTQNIKNYTASKNGPNSCQICLSGIVIIGKNADGFFVNSGNLIENQDIEALESHLGLITSLDKNELKRLYKERLRSELPEGSTSAGLGLMDIARKTRRSLEYHFTPYNAQLTYFSLNVSL